MDPVESRTVDLGGPVHYVTWETTPRTRRGVADFGGHDNDQPPLVLIHGLALSHASWLAVAAKLARGRRVYALDFVGHGKTPLAGRKANLSGHGAVIHRFLHEVVGRPAVLVGHSTGGHLSMLEAAAVPQHVAGLVLVGAAVPVPLVTARVAAAQLGLTLAMAPGILDAAVLLGGRRSGEQAARRLLKFCTPQPDRVPEPALRAMVDLETERRGSLEAARAFSMTVRSLTYWNLRRKRFYEKVARIQAPALILHGRLDPLVPLKAALELHRRRPDWGLAVFPDDGHTPMLERPAAFSHVVEAWLGERFPSPGFRSSGTPRSLSNPGFRPRGTPGSLLTLALGGVPDR